MKAGSLRGIREEFNKAISGGRYNQSMNEVGLAHKDTVDCS